MGCDIHVYAEYSLDGKYWQSLTDNAGSRNYLLFGIIAGVRVEDEQMFPLKGVPEENLSHVTSGAYWMNIAPDEKPHYAEWENWTSRKIAEKWVDRGYSKCSKDRSMVTNPDHHSHSWLTSDELSEALQKYSQIDRSEKLPLEWVGILGAMKAIESAGGKSRVVFWFDN